MKSLAIAIALTVLTLPVCAGQTASGDSRVPGSAAGKPDWSKLDASLRAQLMRKGDAEKGQKAYVMCRGCHKPDASGRPDAGYPQLAGQHASVLVKQMMDQRAGRSDNPKMHPFIEESAVAEDDVADVAAYLSNLPTSTNNRKGDGSKLGRGKNLYKHDCASCHGAAGEGDSNKLLPNVASQHFPYLLRETMDIHDKVRRNANADMVKVLQPYTDADIEAVCDFMSRIPPRTKAAASH